MARSAKADCGYVRAHTDEFINRVGNIWDGLHFEECVLGHPEYEEMPPVRMKLGNGFLLGIVTLD